MPSRFFDYESDLFNLSRKNEDKPKTGLRRPAEPKKPRRCSASEGTHADSTRSSVSSTTSSSESSRVAHHHARSTGVLSMGSHNIRDPTREEQVEPTAQIQQWAHQMHLQQQRQYWWCSSCYPKSPTLRIPTKKAMMKRVRIAEPSHAYE